MEGVGALRRASLWALSEVLKFLKPGFAPPRLPISDTPRSYHPNQSISSRRSTQASTMPQAPQQKPMPNTPQQDGMQTAMPQAPQQHGMQTAMTQAPQQPTMQTAMLPLQQDSDTKTAVPCAHDHTASQPPALESKFVCCRALPH